MVATLLRMRFRILGNTLTSNPWQLVGFIVGLLWAAGMLLLAWTGLFALGFAGLDVARLVLTGGGAMLLLGWTLGPLLIAGVDTTLDPAKLAPFPISTDRMMVTLTAAGLTGVPGIATVAATLGIFLTLFRWPAGVAAAIACIPLGVLTCVLASRLIAALSQGAVGSRRTRELIGSAAFLLLLLAGPIVIGIVNLIEASVSGGADVQQRIEGVIGALSWTPLGAAWAVPGDLAAGDVLPAALKLLIAVVTVAALWWLWRVSLAASLASPARATSAQVRPGRIGWFGRMPTGPMGATWARSQTYWLRDPRYRRQLLTVPIFPLLLLVSSGGDVTSPVFAFSTVLAAYTLGIVTYVDVSYDGTAFATVLATGIRGRNDRAGRVLGAGIIGVPLVILVTVVTVGLSGRWELLAPVLGAAVGTLLTGYGVCAVSSALLVVPVPAPGDSPFAQVPGSGAMTMVSMLAIWLGIGVLALPSFIPAVIAAATGSVVLGWVTLALGVVLGGAVLVAGVFIGGRILDRTGPELLLRMRSFQNA